MDGFTIRDGYVNLNQFEEPNFALRSGAGVLINTVGGGAIVTLNNCILTNNESTYAAGALANTRTTHNITINNSLIFNNEADQIGAMFFRGDEVVTISNTTIANNDSSGGPDSDIFCLDPALFTITNSILWDTDGGDDNQIQVGAGTSNFEYSLIRGFDLTGSNGLDGTNPASDPLFTNPAVNDFTLQTGSPVIDLGDNTAVTQLTDLNGNVRIVDGNGDTITNVDFGAFEAPFVPDTTPPVITCPAAITEDCIINVITYPFPTATDNVDAFVFIVNNI